MSTHKNVIEQKCPHTKLPPFCHSAQFFKLIEPRVFCLLLGPWRTIFTERLHYDFHNQKYRRISQYRCKLRPPDHHETRPTQKFNPPDHPDQPMQPPKGSQTSSHSSLHWTTHWHAFSENCPPRTNQEAEFHGSNGHENQADIFEHFCLMTSLSWQG